VESQDNEGGHLSPFLVDNAGNFDQIVDLLGPKIFVGVGRLRRLFDPFCRWDVRTWQGSDSPCVLEYARQRRDETVDGAARQRFPCGGRRLAISAGPQFPAGHKNFQSVINVFFADGSDGNWAELINPELNAAQ
jgi:hypothetical protein